MQVRMKVQVLAPGMQHGEEADFHAQTLGVAGDGQQSFGGGAEEDVIDDFFVVEGDGGDGLGEGEDHMEVLDGQQLGLRAAPAIGRAPLPGIWGSAGCGRSGTGCACIGSGRTIRQRRPAPGCGRSRWPASGDADAGAACGLPVGGAVLSKDVGQLQGWRRHGRSAGFGAWPGLWALPEPVERADGVGDGVGRDRGIARGGIDPAVAEQHLNDAEIGAVFQQVGGEAVAQGVDGDPFAKARPLAPLPGRRSAATRRSCGGLCAIRGTANPPARFSAAVRQGAGSATSSAALPAGGERAWHSDPSCLCPVDTRMSMRWESISPTCKATTSETRRPAP